LGGGVGAEVAAALAWAVEGELRVGSKSSDHDQTRRVARLRWGDVLTPMR